MVARVHRGQDGRVEDELSRARFIGVHVAVADMPSALAFSRRSGLDVPDGAEGNAHVEMDLGGGVHVAFSTLEVIEMYDPAWRGHRPSTATVSATTNFVLLHRGTNERRQRTFQAGVREWSRCGRTIVRPNQRCGHPRRCLHEDHETGRCVRRG